MLGAWSGNPPNQQGGTARQTDYFAPDGTFVSVAQLPNGPMLRVWGYYRFTPTGANQMRAEFQTQGWLPQQICQQSPQGPTNCQQLPIPTSDVTMVTFTSPNSISVASLTGQGPPFTETRDANPYMLQQQVPQQYVMNIPAPTPGPMPMPMPGPLPLPTPRPTPSPVTLPSGPKCDDLQQRRICNINDGHLISSGGCMVCVAP